MHGQERTLPSGSLTKQAFTALCLLPWSQDHSRPQSVAPASFVHTSQAAGAASALVSLVVGPSCPAAVGRQGVSGTGSLAQAPSRPIAAQAEKQTLAMLSCPPVLVPPCTCSSCSSSLDGGLAGCASPPAGEAQHPQGPGPGARLSTLSREKPRHWALVQSIGSRPQPEPCL